MQHNKVADLAHGRWRNILLALDFDRAFLTGKHGPCPICAGKDRFRFDDKGGDGTWFCNHCGAGKGVELVKLVKGLGFVEAAKLIEGVIGAADVDVRPDEPDDEQTAKSIRTLGHRSKLVEIGDPVQLYLSGRLGTVAIPSCIRTVASCVYKDKGVEVPLSYHPAMIASVRGPDGRASALHRTYLTADGQKAQVPSVRKVLGRIPDGAAVRLAEPAETMGIAEGIETALSATILFDVPTWAALNEGRLRVWQPPEGVRKVIIFADNDMNCKGQRAAWDLAERLRKTMEAYVEMPAVIGTDWNDEMQMRLKA
jgi:putative DNA primase/helicase